MDKQYFQEFVGEILKLEGRKDLEEFLSSILTPKELDEIPKRLQIIKLLKRGVSQREITEKLGVGIATVTRGSTALRNKMFKNLR